MTVGSDICSDTSAYRASICSTSDSITRSSLGHHFHADLVLVGRGAGILDLEHRVHRGDRDGELVEVGLARGELLELHARPHQPPDPAATAVAARELDDLEREAGDQ